MATLESLLGLQPYKPAVAYHLGERCLDDSGGAWIRTDADNGKVGIPPAEGKFWKRQKRVLDKQES